MVLGLIDFLLGGKKKTQVPKTAQVAAPVQSAPANAAPAAAQVPDGQSQPTANNGPAGDELQFQDSNKPETNAASATQAKPAFNPSVGGKKSVVEVIGRLTNQIKEINDNVVNISTEMKDIQNNLSSMDHRVSELENGSNVVNEKLNEIDENMSKFLSLYEVVNNQYNPFVTMEEPKEVKEVVVNADGSSESKGANDGLSLKEQLEQLDGSQETKVGNVKQELESSLLELDTIDLDEAAADAVPLTHLKSNTNSLVVILSWLEYLVKRAGIDETKKTLTYYTETLKWITPEVYFELDKFLRGMDDIKTEDGTSKLNVRDHIVSLYFISKLNEKRLDEKLTKAVLQIIKEK